MLHIPASWSLIEFDSWKAHYICQAQCCVPATHYIISSQNNKHKIPVTTFPCPKQKALAGSFCYLWPLCALIEEALQVRLAAIPSPVNMLNLQAGGYWETIRARMVQAERHARGCADFAYCLKHARSMPHFSWRTVALCLKVGIPASCLSRENFPHRKLTSMESARRPQSSLVPQTLLFSLFFDEVLVLEGKYL